MNVFLNSQNKYNCFGCEACVQACPNHIIEMQEDDEGFRYPVLNSELCIKCGLCIKVCPYENMPLKNPTSDYVFGGYAIDEQIRFESTSGGAFSVIVDTYCDVNYVIFGAESDGINVKHSYVDNKAEISKFRKSKYSQSIIDDSYKDAKKFLREGKKVLFSGTPCQIAGLKSYIGNDNTDNLLTVEVICEGVPSPLYIRKYDEFLNRKFGSNIKDIDYRYTGKSIFQKGKWDFEIMRILLNKGKKEIKKDRWFNPFWNIWLNHLMSRPSCYKCPFTTKERIADISLGDLWGVHLYCPELYGKNGGASVVFCNNDKGKSIILQSKDKLYGHALDFNEALKYQNPMRKAIEENPERSAFMDDLKGNMDYNSINKKWSKAPSIKLLSSKYLWGNRQKVFLWNLFHGKETKFPNS